MSASPFFSIIIVVKDNLSGLFKTIKTTQLQTFTDYELCIIDGSLNSNENRIKGLGDKKIKYYWGKDKGIYDAMNKGISLALGKYFYFLNCEDELTDNSVLKKVNNLILTHNDMYDIFYGGIIQVFKDYSITIHPKSRRTSNRQMIFSHQGAFYRKDILKKNEFDLNFKYAADYDQFIRLLKNDVKMKRTHMIFARCMAGGFTDKNLLNLKIERAKISLFYYNSYSNYIFHGLNIAYEIARSLIFKLLPNELVKTLRRLKSKSCI